MEVQNKYTAAAMRALEEAARAAAAEGSEYVGTEYLLLGLTAVEEGTASVVLNSFDVTRESVSALVRELIDPRSQDGADGRKSPRKRGRKVSVKDPFSKLTPRSRMALRTAGEQAVYFFSKDVGTEHILLALMRDVDCNAAKLLHTKQVDFQAMYTRILDIIGVSDEQLSEYLQMVMQSAGGAGTSPTPTLDQFSRDMTYAVREGKIDPIIGRRAETERICQILCRRTKNNPCLMGEPGVGKTAIVEGLAEKIVSGDVPEPLQNKRIVALDMAAMVAGSKYRGEFEERIKRVLSEAAGSPDVLLFIDELHTIIGAGGSEGALDAANIMKPMLSRGEIQVIGATTVDEYRKHVEKDAALARRFQPILVEEPSQEDSVEILKGLRAVYEKHHGVKLPDETLEAAVSLSARYISDRFLPDKAIDLMDEACSKRQLGYYQASPKLSAMEKELAELKNSMEEALTSGDMEKAHELHERSAQLQEKLEGRKTSERSRAAKSVTVTPEDIAQTVSGWTKIPVQKLTEDESRRLLRLEKTLHGRIIGQEEAVSAVARAIRRGRAGLKDPKRPIGSFLFLGPTGVGKTELSKALAETVFGSESSMIRVDMSEYMEKFDVSKLVGSPPGYVGYDEGGQLSEQVRRHPYSVVLFDEIEKAHPDIFNILLQVLDEGHITDSQGRRVDFKNTILIMTSNAGAQAILNPKRLGFGAGDDAKANYNAMKDSVMGEIRRLFKPEFLNRIDDTIVFHSLSKDEIKKIVTLLLKDLKKRAKEQMGISLKVRPSVRDHIAEKGFDEKYGARPLKRAIQNDIEDELAENILSGNIKAGQTVVCTMKGNNIVFQSEG